MYTKLNWIPCEISLDPEKQIIEDFMVKGCIILDKKDIDKVIMEVYPATIDPNERVYVVNVYDHHDKSMLISYKVNCGSLTGACMVAEDLVMAMLCEKIKHASEMLVNMSNMFNEAMEGRKDENDGD